jgi:hypothetical protein
MRPLMRILPAVDQCGRTPFATSEPEQPRHGATKPSTSTRRAVSKL